MSDLTVRFLSVPELREVRTRIVRELERFREPMLHDHVRVYELRDGRVLWTREKPEIYGHYGSVWPSEDALWRHIHKPPTVPGRKKAPTLAALIGLDEADLQPGSLEATRVALAEALSVPAASLDYSRASFRRLNGATRREPIEVWYEPEWFRPLIAYFGEAVRRAVDGRWAFQREPHGLRVEIESSSAHRIDFIDRAYWLVDEAQYPDWVSTFDECLSHDRQGIDESPG